MSAAPAAAPTAGEFVKALPANPAGDSAGSDGFVRSRQWVALNWANPAEVSAWKRTAASDDVVLVMKLKKGKQDKAALGHTMGLSLAASGSVRIDIFNSARRKIPLAFAVYTTVDRVYSESELRPLRPGWNRVVFDLAASTYKSAASNWEHKAPIWGREDVREFVLLFYDKGEATLAIDSIQIATAPAAGAAAGTTDEHR